MEEYISLFITYLAYKQENPDAAISSLSLEKMDVKEFDRNKNALNIDALTSQDIAQMGDDAETEDDIRWKENTTQENQINFYTLYKVAWLPRKPPPQPGPTPVPTPPALPTASMSITTPPRRGVAQNSSPPRRVRILTSGPVEPHPQFWHWSRPAAPVGAQSVENNIKY